MNTIYNCVRRPIAVAMIYFVITALGVYFFIKTPLKQLPTVTTPSLTVSTSWPNTSAETVEAFVTSPVEAVVNTVKGANSVTSTSSEGTSRVSVGFVKGTDMDFAALELKEKIAMLKSSLPSGVGYPSVSAYNPDTYYYPSLGGYKPAEPLRFTFTGPYTLSYLREFAEAEIQPNLIAIAGVGNVDVVGGQPRVIRIEIDPVKADMYGISEGTIRNVLSSLEQKRNVGYLLRSGVRYDVYTENTADEVKNISELAVVTSGGKHILLKDVAAIFDAFEEPRSHYRINGNPVVNITVEQEEGANLILFVKETKERMEELKEKFEPGMDIVQENDPSLNIKTDLQEVEARGLFSILAVFIVLYIFIRSFRIPLIIMSTILFSALITIIIFYAMGIDFNVMTIAGLSLGFGMLVDSAIVVVDNVFRYRERGFDPYESVEKGASEVFMPITASVFTTIIVFVPFIYLQQNRELYIPLALAVVFSLLASIAVAFTFIPAYIMKIFPYTTETFRTKAEKNRVMQFIKKKHKQFIEYTIYHKYATAVVVIAVFAGSYWMFTRTVPSYSYGSYTTGGQETYLSVSVRLPPGSVLERANKIAIDFEDILLGRQYIRKVTTQVSETSVRIDIRFTNDALNTAFPWQLKDELASFASTFAGVSVTVSGVGDYFSSGFVGSSSTSATFRVNINGYNYSESGKIAENLGKMLEGKPRFGNIDPNYYGYTDTYDVVVKIKRDKLKVYNLTVQSIISLINNYIRRSNISSTSASITVGGKVVNYAIKIKRYQDLQLEDLKKVVLISPSSGEQVCLSTIADFSMQKVMGTIRRDNQQYQRVLGIEFRGPQPKGKELVDNAIKSQYIPTGYSVKDASGYTSYMSTKEKLNKWIAIFFAILLVYMVTSSLYESFLHPLVIMLTVPMALIGVFLIYFFMGKAFSDAAYVGVILLSGIVVNNAIILIDHINLLRSRGLDLYTAVIQGTQDRVRAILMTSGTTIVGMLPLILKGPTSGYDTKIWYSLALSTIGGMISSTPLTLLVIPVFYILAEDWRRKFRRQWENV